MKPVVAGWSFTSMCNLACKHCYNKSGKPKDNELTTEQAKEVANKLIKARIAAVNFGGGECPLRDDFIDICKILHKAGIKISLTTNGLTFDKFKDYLHLFHDIGVSIDFADEKRHDWQRGVKGAFKEAVKTIKELVRQGVNTEIVTCITKLNSSKEETSKLYKLCKMLDVDYWRLNRYRPTGREGWVKKLKLEPKDLKEAYEFLASKAPEGFVIPDPLFALLGKKVRHCPSAKTSFRIQPDGEVSPSVFLKESGGNILTKTLEQIYDSVLFSALRNRELTGKCVHCHVKEECKGGCAANAYLEYGSFNKPDPLCWKSNDWNVHELYLCTAYVPIRGAK